MCQPVWKPIDADRVLLPSAKGDVRPEQAVLDIGSILAVQGERDLLLPFNEENQSAICQAQNPVLRFRESLAVVGRCPLVYVIGAGHRSSPTRTHISGW